MAYPRHQRSRDFKFLRRVGGNLTLTSATYADVDTTLDLTLAAQIGDVIEYAVLGLFGAENNSANLDGYSVVSGAVVNPWAASGTGTAYTGWYKPVTASAWPFGGSVMKALVAGDLSAGTVTLRLRGRRDGSTNVSVFGTTDIPLNVWAKNLGPQDPN